MRHNGEMSPKGEIVLYQSKDRKIQLEVKLEQETIWLTQTQVAALFGISRSVITKHIRNIFNSEELEEKSNVQKMHIALSDKPVMLYNLDVVISVGYRVNSTRATQFRIWATSVLKKHLIEGYTLNEKRLREQGDKIRNLQKAVNSIKSKKRLEYKEALGLVEKSF